MLKIWRNLVRVPNVGDVVLPALTRKLKESTEHEDEDDFYDGVGGKHTSELVFEAMLRLFDESDLFTAFEDGSLDEWAIEFKTGGNLWSFIGLITALTPAPAPVDGGALRWVVHVQPLTGIDELHSLMLLETGGHLLLETGGRFALERD